MMTLRSRLNAWLARRRRTPQWLLIRPHTDGRWQWLHSGDGLQGDWPPPALYLNLDAALVLPATACSHFDLPAPPGLKPAEWPQLLEEQLLQPAGSVQVGCIGKQHRRLQLLVVQREVLRRWLDECAALGVHVSRCWAEPQLMAQALPVWERDADYCLKLGVADERRRWLVWPKALGPLPDAMGALPQQCGHWPSLGADLSKMPSVFPLRRTARRERLPVSAGQWRLAAVCLGLALSWGALGGWQDWQQTTQARAQVVAITGPVATAQQAGRMLQRLQREQADAQVRQQQLDALEQALGVWLDGEAQWQLHSSDFDGKRWQVVLVGAGRAPEVAHWQAMADAAGARLQSARTDASAGLELSFNWETP
ncbi:type II secretion system protein GspL [Pseudomonas sp. R5(2019)]|uniref:type II secretion system protein GspL n=1 Tax=Pseudomonas sp. R5(2019) TaxID=2697566 RepID=UPI0014123FB0|nr:type II secretion system protein GspL [Pseudomonas sp. R5(2019)]NBA98000.1 type II secretion system protein GspL [Pseudomonas sp. R5(2019)]